MTTAGVAKSSPLWRYPGLIAACLLLAAFLSACGEGRNASSERVLGLEAKMHSLEESLEAMQEENTALKSELAALRQEQTSHVQEQEAAGAVKEREAVATPGEDRREQLADLEEERADAEERLDDLDSRLRDLEAVASQVELVLPAIETWFKGIDDRVRVLEGSDLERTVKLAEEAGGEVYYIGHPERKERAVLVVPSEIMEDTTPLVVSLHGYGGNSADHALYVPLHERVNRDGFALLLPNGAKGPDGNRFWNPTGQSNISGNVSRDDAAYLAHLVVEAQMLRNFNPVYIFGYSNGGFMAYWMACQGLPGLRAIASLAGTSYVDDAACEGAPPVSVLHIHGSADEVVLYSGVVAEPRLEGDAEPPSYAGGEEMLKRWGKRAGCDWPEDPQPYTTLDLDAYVSGAETQAYRLESVCGDGISIEMWMGEGSSHGPGYGDAFTDALLDWLLAQQ